VGCCHVVAGFVQERQRGGVGEGARCGTRRWRRRRQRLRRARPGAAVAAGRAGGRGGGRRWRRQVICVGERAVKAGGELQEGLGEARAPQGVAADVLGGRKSRVGGGGLCVEVEAVS
jgi:hypothetical protein